MISLSIDVTLLDKTRFKRVTRRNGKDAVFCDLVLIDTPNSEYGDYICKQSVTKEERAAKKEMPILGNGKILEKNSSPRPNPKPSPAASEAPQEDGPGDSVPF